MKKLLLALFATSAFTTGIHAQQIDQDAAMKAWTEYLTPGKVHQMMAKSNGKWTVATSTWMDPSAPPVKSKGIAINKMILGGRYQEATFTGTMFDKPFEGRSITGYDNKKGVFKNTWIDNMGTGILYLEGKWNAEEKAITFTGAAVDPMTGDDTPVRQVLTFKDDNHEHVVMYQTMGGQEVKMMEIEYTRSTK